jgi:hypothetical protein
MPLVLKKPYPPKVSKKPPEPNIFPFGVDDPEAGNVWVSWPQPDRITILGDLKPEHFAGLDDGPDFAVMAASMLTKPLASGALVSAPKSISNTGYFNANIVQARKSSPTHAGVTKMAKVLAGAPVRLRLEFNPRKIGPIGLAKTEAALTEDATLGFNLFAWLADACLTRLDLAVDLIGVEPDDLLVFPAQPGKRSVISGANGAIQSKYFLRKKKTDFDDHASAPPNWNDAYLRVYDRRIAKIEAGKEPTYGAAKHTRVETVSVWKKKRPSFLSLPALVAGLSAVSIKRRLFSGLGGPEWTAVCDAVELRGKAWADKHPVQAIAPPPHAFEGTDPIWRPSAIASHMAGGLKACGLAAWLEQAEQQT